MPGGGEIFSRRRLSALLPCAASGVCLSAYPRPQEFPFPFRAAGFIRRILRPASGRDAVAAEALDSYGLGGFRGGESRLAACRVPGAELDDPTSEKSRGEFGTLLQGALVIGERLLIFAHAQLDQRARVEGHGVVLLQLQGLGEVRERIIEGTSHDRTRRAAIHKSCPVIGFQP